MATKLCYTLLMNIQKLGHSLAQAARWQRRYESCRLEQFRLSPRTLPFYLSIAHKEGLSQKELMIKLVTDKTRTTKAVNSLVESGYVERKINLQDNRIKGVFLTDRGREIFPEVDRVLKRLDSILSGKLSEQEMSQFIAMLDIFSESVRLDIKDNK